MLAIGAAFTLGGCRQDMHDQPRLEPLEQSDFFADGQASRQPVAGTVPRGGLREDRHLYEGLDELGDPAATFPFAVTAEVLTRGRQRYDIFCSPCHDRVGTGRGMIVRRGFKQPPSLHEPRLREAPPGYFFDVMSKGFGQMSSYAAQVPVADRWAIAAYLRALQRSQYAPADTLAATDLAAIASGVRPVPPAVPAPLPGDTGATIESATAPGAQPDRAGEHP